jgi:type III restriction enzyme
VTEITRPAQGTLEGVVAAADVGRIVVAVANTLAEKTIELPEIVVLPTSDVTFSFLDFNLTGHEHLRPQPMSSDILVHELRTEQRRTIARIMADRREERPEDYLVSHLIGHDEVDYDSNADLLYKLAGQMVAHLRGYLPDGEDVENVLLNQGKSLAEFIFQQMMKHYVETPTRYIGHVSKGFQLLRPLAFKVSNVGAVKDFRRPVVPVADTKRHVFSGFSRCGYEHQSFQSDEERRFAVLIDLHESGVIRWVKPGPKQFQIEYRRTERYEPDFVVETATDKLIVEIKARRDMTDETVQAKATAARTWVGYANRHAATYGGKPWQYVLIPHDEMTESATLAGLVARFNLPPIIDEEVEFEPVT